MKPKSKRQGQNRTTGKAGVAADGHKGGRQIHNSNQIPKVIRVSMCIEGI